jgi:hypothetical protein
MVTVVGGYDRPVFSFIRKTNLKSKAVKAAWKKLSLRNIY